MKKTAILFVLCFSAHFIFAQQKPAYLIFNKNGQAATYEQMLEASILNRIVLFGELHNNPISHWLQLELSKDLHERVADKLVLGAEMLEADNQIIVDEYLAGHIAYRNFKADARLWNNFETDYKPLLDLAKANGFPFIATNIPRRYAAVVNNDGFEGLEKLTLEARRYIAPLPIAYDPNLPGYTKMLEMTGMPGRQASENFPKAQAVKDATMAYFISQNTSERQIFMHFHGAFHSDFFDGIYWYLKQIKPDYEILTITTVEQQNIQALETEHIGRADFIICVPSSMTKTY